MLTSAAPSTPQSSSAISIPAAGLRAATGRTQRGTAAEAEQVRFETCRRLAARVRRAPVQRVAALLLAISRNNEHEGRDPSAIPDALACGFVADLLDLSVASLADALVALEERRLIARGASSGVRVTDPAGLDRLAA